MITVRRDVDAPADAVWGVLADGWTYPSWAVGVSRMRAVDPAWPGVGTQLHHSVGSWPLLLDDTTTVLACVPKRELVLRNSGWPMGATEVRLTVTDHGSSCEVVLAEYARSGPLRLLPGPARTTTTAPRNAESLRRLAYLAEGESR